MVSSNSNNNLNSYFSYPQAFANLQQEIRDVNGPVLYLNHDYSNYENIHVSINKDLVIDGQGHTIDCMGRWGLSSFSGNVCLKNLNIINAHVEGNGGAISIGHLAQYTIENCTFSNNEATNYGGAIYNAGSSPLTITDCTFQSNSAYWGGGIYSCGRVYINDKQSDDGRFHSFFLNNKASSTAASVYSSFNVYATNTKFEGNVADYSPSGIYSEKKVSVIRCLFDSNKERFTWGEGSGGAICAMDDVTVDNSTFSNNYAQCVGGAICSEKGDVYINYNQSNTQVFNSFFIGNSVDTGHGGAIFTKAYFGKVYVKNTVFDSNQANVDGGAIFSGASIEATNCIFKSNKAVGSTLRTCYGGAIRTYYSAYINNCSFFDNYAENDGGAICTRDLTLVNTPSYFKGNTADKGKGGAIYTDTFTQNVKYAVFISNTAGKGAHTGDDGGAIYINKENHVTFSYCVFIDNSCTDEGGAIYLDSTSSKLTLIHNVFINNKARKEGQTVFNKGDYGSISGNWWRADKPTSQNDQLIEWVAFGHNVHHVDSSPLYSIPDDMNSLVPSSYKPIVRYGDMYLPTDIFNGGWNSDVTRFKPFMPSYPEKSATNSSPFSQHVASSSLGILLNFNAFKKNMGGTIISPLSLFKNSLS